MNLWLDDVRSGPCYWAHATTVRQAKDFLTQNRIEFASLDHDLGLKISEVTKDGFLIAAAVQEETGYDLVKWMAETSTWPSKGIRIHSSNPIAFLNMGKTIERYGPYQHKLGTFYSANRLTHKQWFDIL